MQKEEEKEANNINQTMCMMSIAESIDLFFVSWL